MSFILTQQKCKACEETVYPVDQLSPNGTAYHKACFKCSHCKGILKEDEIRKKIEELLNERQRRIAERIAFSGVARAMPQSGQFEGKASRICTKSDKNKTQSMKDTNRISFVKVRGI